MSEREKYKQAFKGHILPSLVRHRSALADTPAVNIVTSDDQCIDTLLSDWEQTLDLVKQRDRIEWRRSYGAWPNQVTIEHRSVPMAKHHRVVGVVGAGEIISCLDSRENGLAYPRLFLFQADPAPITSFWRQHELPPATYWIAETDCLIDFIPVLFDSAADTEPGRWARSALDDLGITSTLNTPRGFQIDDHICTFTLEAYQAWGGVAFVDPDGAGRWLHSGGRQHDR